MAEAWQSLDRYDAAPTTDGRLVVRSTSRRRGYAPRRVTRGTPRIGSSIEAYGAAPALAVADARSRPVGSRVVVDASLVVGGGLPPRLCNWRLRADSTRVCVGPAAVARDVTWSEPATSWSIQGPFAVRVTEDGFADVTEIGRAYVPGGLLRPYAWQGVKVEGAFSTVAFFGPHAAAVGGEADLTWRWTGWTHGSVWARLIGDDVGIGLRARGLATSESASGEWLAGLAPISEFSDPYRNVSYPSIPGLLLPEVGVGYRKPEAFPYLAWTVPVVFHLASPRERRHPFGAREVLGIRIAPTARIAFGPGSPELQVGASAGATLW